MAKVRNSFHYDAPPERVWNLVTDCTALAQVCHPYLAFEGLPDGRIFDGQKIDVMVSLFGKLPAQPYEMHVVACDNDGMTFESHENGAGVKSWNHHLRLHPDGDGTRLDEEIEIDAGWLTPLFKLWANVLYHARHKPRVALLQSGTF